MAKLTVPACRAARALLGWGIRELAENAGVGVMSVSRYEADRPVQQETIDKLQAAFEANGVEITNGTGTGAKLLNERPKPKSKRKTS